MGDSAAAPPLNLGFVAVGESEQQPMGIEGGGGESAESLVHGRCNKRRRSPSLAGDGEDSPKSTSIGDDADEWFISDSGSEEDEDYDQGKIFISLSVPFIQKC
jgi:hypothetical protein